MGSHNQRRNKAHGHAEQTPKVCISVINWNNYRNTIQCLESLQQLDYANYDVVVIDNASCNDSVARIQAAFPDQRVIQAPENLGFAAGHALAIPGAREGDAELLWLLNNDATVRPDTLRRLVDAYHQLGDALFGSIPLDAETETLIECTAWGVTDTGEPRFLQDAVVMWDTPYHEWAVDNHPRRAANVSGSSMVIPLSVITQHGFMDESFFLYGEENDYCFRLARQGIPSYLVPGSVIVHRLRGASEANPVLQAVIRYYKVRNQLRLVRTCLGHRRFLAHVLQSMRRHTCLKVLVKAILLRRNVRQREPRNYFGCWGIWDALWDRRGKTFAPEAFWTQTPDSRDRSEHA